VVRLSAADPLNLAGIIVPGPRVPALHTHTVSFRDGIPEVDDVSVVAATGDRVTAAV
jgi:ATP-dependent Lhr-like helicase